MHEENRQAPLGVHTSWFECSERWIFWYWIVTALMVSFSTVGAGEIENKFVVQEWHKQGLVAAITDPAITDPSRDYDETATVMRQLEWSLISATLQSLDEAGRREVIPRLEKLFEHPYSDVVKTVVRELVKMGVTDEATKRALGQLHDSVSSFDPNEGQEPGILPIYELAEKFGEYAEVKLRFFEEAPFNRQPIQLSAVLSLLSYTYGYTKEIGLLRFYAHFLGGGVRENEIAIACLGRNYQETCNLTNLNPEAAREYLHTFRKAWDASEKFGDLRKDLANKISMLVTRGNWSNDDLKDIEDLKQQFEKHGDTYLPQANMLRDALNRADRRKWLKRTGLGWIVHALFWLALIFVYPRSPQVQAIFFWNKWVRKFAGLFYVGALVTWVPFLRNRLLAPFRESLLADADLKNFVPDRYFAGCSVRLKPDGKSESIDHSIPAIHGQTILEGESGLGKTMFLRRFAYRATRPTVYLFAHRCEAGVIEAIQGKLFGYAQDKDFLQSLVYSGALDVCIDGLNEVSPDTRVHVSNFLDRFVKSNVLIGTQPLEWMPPKTARVFILEPLSPEQIEAFLLTRVDELPDDAPIKGNAYESACKDYLTQALGQFTSEDAKQTTLRMLSNPMDLTVVSLMLARGEEPDFFHLHEQQYRLMAADYKRVNLDNAFPLKGFAEQCYQMRLKDEVTIDQNEIQSELLCMERHKMVVKRQLLDTAKNLQIEWRFRHDKIMEFFIVQTFLGPDNERPEKHLGDGRFRGVYLLLATFLPIAAAHALREQLILYAAQTQDHTVSDTFVRLLHGRKEA